ncbi:tetraacyldisaccharide 4'-kinase [Vibrio sp. CAIM 722]|uniref:Tetraacyldisaccharide 4'-kinase n=1 Tax=Vibrio eleionomae TaxID=2653505 RepID=A0A7X4RTH3_9VIBR|nr:tetraacyldisaccharide 4'-kinase [Vibrio eleionomae]
MIEKIWFHKSVWYFVLWPLLWPLSKLFAQISMSRRHAYQQGNKESYRAPIPVVVVGNITAGGNGKTPVVVWLVETLLELGYRPGVVSRGYGGKAPQYPLVLTPQTPAAHSGDEPKLIQQRTGVPVAVAPIRSEAVKALLVHDVNIIITDDGLQHYALQRDIEFVVVDGARRFGNEQMIPLGPLREPLSRLPEVDFIITNGGHAEQGEIAMTLAPQMAINLITGERRPANELHGLVAFAGIGHPPRFFATLEQLGAKLIHTAAFADHQDFSQSELYALSERGENVIMTEKDAVKCAHYAQENWWYLPVTAAIESVETQRILDKIKEVTEHYGS